MVQTVPVTANAETVDLLQGRHRSERLAEAAKVDRLPPHALEAEQGVLGCVLLSPNDGLALCLEKLKAGGQVFYDLRHRHLFELLVQMYDRKEPIDLITVQQRLKDANQLEAVGGLAYLASLPDAVPSAANLSYYLDIVREKHLLRQVIQTCSAAVAQVYEYEGEIEPLLDGIERAVMRINQDRIEQRHRTIKDLVHKAINTVEELHQSQGHMTGLATGFPDLDQLTSGLHAGEMIVIAARPSMGKTSLAMNLVEHITVEQKVPVGVFSLEMTAESLVLRMLCSRARVNLRDIRDGFLVERDFPKLTGAAGELAGAPLFIDDTPGLSILQLRARARRLAQQHGIRLFVVDYLQLLNSTSRRAENRQQEISDISNGLKSLAKELQVPVVVLSQLNREIEKERNRKPRLSDLRESGAIEQDADLVGLLYKADPNDHRKPASGEEDDDLDQPALPVNLLIAKQRNGPTGDVCLTFLKGYTRFESASKINPGEVPG